jgi:hypothetical protein
MLRPTSGWLLLVLLGLAACDNDISSSSRLRRPRLLAVQAEPPNPAFGQATRLRPLVYLPAGQSVTYEWSWCPVPTSPDDGYRCPVDQAALDSLAVQAGLQAVPPLSLGSTEIIDFTNPFPPAMLACLCAGDSSVTDLFGNAIADRAGRVYVCGPATLSMQVMLTIRGSLTETGVVSLRLPIDETTSGNSNPVISGISVLLPEAPGLLDDTGSVLVPRDVKVRLRAEVDEAQSEVYLDRQVGSNDDFVKGSNGQFILAPTRERLRLTWFSEGGGFIDNATEWGPGDLDSNGQPTVFSSAIENDWSTPKVEDYAPSSSLVLVVARDNRGGVSWAHGVASLGGAP